ncbi:MAG: hypothetical protein M1570_03765 [Chloroflexi bacterium]|nr:hypothetical protein [Chloroflexota bacterium]
MKRTSLSPIAFVLRLAVLLAILSTPLSVFAAQSSQSQSPVTPYAPRTSSSVAVEFVQIANSANILGDSTYIDHPLTNGNPNALVFVTPNWNPGGIGKTYENYAIGVWYDKNASKWAIFNQDKSNMATDVAFNVLIPPPGPNVFVQTANAGNSAGDYTDIDNPLTNNNPNAILFVTPNYNPGGGLPGVYDNVPIGVWYNDTTNKWSIFNQDRTAIPLGAAFNVFVPSAGSNVFIQTASTTNTNFDFTDIDNPLTNNNAYPLLFVTPNWNPGGAHLGVYDDQNIGVWYNASSKKMSVFNQDYTTSMPVGAAFNVLVAPLNTAVFVQTATAGNSAGDYTDIDNPLSNGNPNAVVMATPDYNPGGRPTGVYDDHSIGVWYNDTTNKWSIFNQDHTAIPLGAAFNVLVFTTDAGEFVQKATTANIAHDWTDIYYPLTNGNPNALVFVTPNWNPGGIGNTYENHAIGVWYDNSSKWAIFNQDKSNMAPDVAFNVLIPPPGANVFVQTANAGNSAGDHTDIDNPLTNNNPQAIFVVTPNWNPGGIGNTYENHAIGVRYNTGTNKWSIFDQDQTAIPPGAAFNVYVTSSIYPIRYYGLWLPLLVR